MGYDSKIFLKIVLHMRARSLARTHTHTHTQAHLRLRFMSFSEPSYPLSTVHLYSATVWQQMDSSAFI